MIAISEHPMAYPVIVETPRDRSCILPVLRGRLCISTWMEMLDAPLLLRFRGERT